MSLHEKSAVHVVEIVEPGNVFFFKKKIGVLREPSWNSNVILSFSGSRTQRVQDLGLSTFQSTAVALWQETATGIRIYLTLIPLALLGTLLLEANLPAQHGPSGRLRNLAGTKRRPSQKFQLSRRTTRGRSVKLPAAWQ